MVLIHISLFVLLIRCWFEQTFEWVLIFITIFLTQGYGTLPESVFIIKPYDYVNVFLVIASISGYIQNKNFFQIRKTFFAYFVYLLLVYQIFEIFYTLSTGSETLGNIIKVSRISIIYLSFFILRQIPFIYFRKFVKLNLYFCIAQGVLFYLQPLGLRLLQGRIDEITSSGQISRYTNCTDFTLFYLFYCLLKAKSIYTKTFYTLFWGGMLILAQFRGDFLAIGLSFTIYYLIKNRLKYYITFLFVGLLASVLIIPMFQYRDKESNRASFIEDITNILNTEDIADIKNDSGNFTFRIAMLIERWSYLIENPQYMLTGVGCIHEDSPNCYNRFDFIIGTKNEDRYYGQCLIESGDITWVPILLRYGIVGVCIYLSILIYWILTGSKFFKKSNNSIYTTTSLMGIIYTLTSVNSALFDSYTKIFILLFCITYIIKYHSIIDIVYLLNMRNKKLINH